MTATETVDRRTILRYRGEPVTHDVRFRGATSYSVHAAPGIVAACSCGWEKPLEGGRYNGDDLASLARQHAGIEDDDP